MHIVIPLRKKDHYRSVIPFSLVVRARHGSGCHRKSVSESMPIRIRQNFMDGCKLLSDCTGEQTKPNPKIVTRYGSLITSVYTRCHVMLERRRGLRVKRSNRLCVEEWSHWRVHVLLETFKNWPRGRTLTVAVGRLVLYLVFWLPGFSFFCCRLLSWATQDE